MIKCKVCNTEKPSSEYYKGYIQLNGTGICKPCKAIKDKAWHQNKKIREWLKEQK